MISNNVKQFVFGKPSRRAISLMEVVLSLAILGVASAYLAQSMQLAVQNAVQAQRLAQAELVAESVMNQMIAGVIPAQPVGVDTLYEFHFVREMELLPYFSRIGDHWDDWSASWSAGTHLGNGARYATGRFSGESLDH